MAVAGAWVMAVVGRGLYGCRRGGVAVAGGWVWLLQAAAGGVYEWHRITLFIETIGEFYRGDIYQSYIFHGCCS
ncbi:hypothetical protein [Bartonella grahamii]|uniref:hypothetical protein n=1 Tax=Bartonella grahamii TaxID=33045 RepID=UPI002E7BD3A6|nr:hypothetical protein [Bartonella grahamii]